MFHLSAYEICFIETIYMVTIVKYTELPQLSLQGKLIKSRRLQSKAVKKNKRENSK